ncbi:MAG: Alkylated repair protein AlkB [Myxococcaceae bacterium]|nr:Alkylated repair protein AlkB [Myxococcaceae bacterium]
MALAHPLLGSRQVSLFGGEAPALDTSFADLEHIALEDGAWLELQRRWLRGHEHVFEALARELPWRDEDRKMYERTVDVPRLVAVLPARPSPQLALIEDMRRALYLRYRTAFERTGFAYYRAGKDSVAWHGDYVARRMQEALVATVSVGAPRKFLLRRTGGGPSIALTLGWGDLLVMGGTCQRTYQHAIPKVAHADPRISIMFRPVWKSPTS